MTANTELAERRRANLAAWMEAKGVNGTELAARLGVGRAYVSLLFRPDRFFGEKSARSMEKKLHLPSGFLDSDGALPEATEAWAAPQDLEDGLHGLIPRVELSLSESGELVRRQRRLPPVPLHKTWLLKMGVTTRDNLVLFNQRGDAMEPEIRGGDVVLIDLGQSLVHDGDIYAVVYSNEIKLRRLSKRVGGGLLVSVDGAKHPDETLSSDQMSMIKILGRVIGRAG